MNPSICTRIELKKKIKPEIPYTMVRYRKTVVIFRCRKRTADVQRLWRTEISSWYGPPTERIFLFCWRLILFKSFRRINRTDQYELFVSPRFVRACWASARLKTPNLNWGKTQTTLFISIINPVSHVSVYGVRADEVCILFLPVSIYGDGHPGGPAETRFKRKRRYY